MKIAVITSFNKEYYNNIGKECVSSWLSFWPTELNLTCYVEEFNLNISDRINQISFDKLPKEYYEFQNSDLGSRIKIFAKKAYSIIHAFENIDADRIIWIDADLITTAQVDLDFLHSLCDDKTLSTFMGVWHGKEKGTKGQKDYFSCETGFFIVNKSHKGFKEFSKRYREYYDNRITENLRRFYDGEVFGAVVQEFNTKYRCRDLSDELSKNYNSPLKHTILGNYFHHYKSKHAKENFAND
jgi:hypothetical protein